MAVPDFAEICEVLDDDIVSRRISVDAPVL